MFMRENGGMTTMSEPTKPAPLAPSAPTNPAPLAPAATAEPPKTFWQKAQRWFMIVCGVIIGIGGLIQLYKAFTPQLPGCAADSTATVLRDIFKKKDVELTVLNNMKTVTDTSSEQTCQAHIETPAETGTISYSITLQGSNFQIRIDKVEAAPR
jgi:hypothetical protein